MNNTKDIQIKDFNYILPDERIAKFPKSERDSSKLLVYNRKDISEDHFHNIAGYLPEGSLMVFNNTKVIQARLHFRKETGALIEVFLLEPIMPSDYEQAFQTHGMCSWCCLIGNLKKWKEGELSRTVSYQGREIKVTVSRGGLYGTGHEVVFKWDSDELSFAELIDIIGELPIPPYLNRDTEESDKSTYQTVYSKIMGSVAAPTAGLHFTDRVLDAISSKGVDTTEITLHVGAGTFKPVKSETIGCHDMHTEALCIPYAALKDIAGHGASAIAVGTTSVRTLESLYYIGLKIYNNNDIAEEDLIVSQWEPYEKEASISATVAIESIIAWMDRHHVPMLHASTQIIIVPGYEFKIVKMLITNFHQPQSTLLLLVSAFVKGDWKNIYNYALAHDFRFLSYGDSSILIP